MTMFGGGSRLRGRAGVTVAAATLAGLLAVAGCGSGGSTGSGAVGGLTGSQPAWAKALGAGVTVIPPGTASPGNGSPQAVMAGVIAAVDTGHYPDFCKYEPPSEQSECSSEFAQASPSTLASEMPTFKNVTLGYTAIDGARALVGITGTVCDSQQTPKCYTNTDPAAIFDSEEPFGALWTETINASSNGYSLGPLTKIGGSWYIYDSTP